MANPTEQKEKLNKAVSAIIEVITDSLEPNVEQRMLNFANYCIAEGFTSNATQKDLENYQKRMDNKNTSHTWKTTN